LSCFLKGGRPVQWLSHGTNFTCVSGFSLETKSKDRQRKESPIPLSCGRLTAGQFRVESGLALAFLPTLRRIISVPSGSTPGSLKHATSTPPVILERTELLISAPKVYSTRGSQVRSPVLSASASLKVHERAHHPNRGQDGSPDQVPHFISTISKVF